MNTPTQNPFAGIGVLPQNFGTLLFDPNTGLLNQFINYDLKKTEFETNAAIESRVGSLGGNNGVANAEIFPVVTGSKPLLIGVGVLGLALVVALVVKE